MDNMDNKFILKSNLICINLIGVDPGSKILKIINSNRRIKNTIK